MYQFADQMAKDGADVVVVAAVNATRTNTKGMPLKWDSDWKGFGSMCAGSALAMAKRYPFMQKWWASMVRDGVKHGFHLSPYASKGVRLAVAVVKTNWWQEPPKDREHMLAHLILSIAEIKQFAEAHPELIIFIPMMGCGYGRVKENDVRRLFKALPDNVGIFA